MSCDMIILLFHNFIGITSSSSNIKFVFKVITFAMRHHGEACKAGRVVQFSFLPHKFTST